MGIESGQTIGSDGVLHRDIRNQLRHMLATPRFKNAETQADFLELVVGRALQGKQTRGSDIAKALFEHKDEINVRSNANHLRKTLERYYSQEGIEDLVLIALPTPPRERSVKLPEGVAYTPEFFYNPRHAVAKAIRLGDYHLIRGTYEDSASAARYFVGALDNAPGTVRAALGVAEALCTALNWSHDGITEAEVTIIVDTVAATLDNVAQEAR